MSASAFFPHQHHVAKAVGFPLWRFSLHPEWWAAETTRSSMSLGCFQSCGRLRGGVQGGKEATRALPSGHKAFWLTTLVPGGLLAGRKGCGARKAPGVPLPSAPCLLQRPSGNSQWGDSAGQCPGDLGRGLAGGGGTD